MIYIESGLVYDTNAPTVLYDNLFAQGTLSGFGGDPDFPVENAITGATWDYWKPSGSAARDMSVELATSSNADCLFIAAHNMADVGASFSIRTSMDGSTWTAISDTYTPTDNSPIMVLFPEQSSKYWRLTQVDGPASIGVAMIGKKLAFEYGFEDPISFRHGQTVEVMGGNSIGGQFLGQKIRRKGGNTTFAFPWLSADWVKNSMADFENHYNEGKPFAMAMRPDYDEDELAYCWRPDSAGELRPSYQVNGASMNMNLRVDYYVSA